MSTKADLLALQASQNQAMVDAINSLPEAAPADPLQAQLDAANAKVLDLQSKLDASNALIEKVDVEVKAIDAEIAPKA